MDTDFTYERRTVLSTAEPALLWWDSKSQSLDMSTRQVPHWTYVQNNCFYRQLFSIVRSLRIGNIFYAFCKADRCNNLRIGNRCVVLAEATGLPPGKWIVRLLTSIHRLTTASLEWRSQVDSTLKWATDCHRHLRFGILQQNRWTHRTHWCSQPWLCLSGKCWTREQTNIIIMLLAVFRQIPWGRKQTDTHCGKRYISNCPMVLLFNARITWLKSDPGR